ncbi:uncharacterized protein LOC129949027 [Eupeodes corollae]|uniref:uncharacterized protein LOC129949027 n=1 Tax=Eupeodes corollae TaxID=290404 RepID=UPI0024908CFE|nr:uncharacterized protein LOC129949027 [Eupeodes corollae]
MRKKNRTKHCSTKADKKNIEIENQSYESLVKKKNEIIKLLREDDTKNSDNFNLEKPKDLDLFQRRESTMDKSTIPSVDPSIIDSVKCVLNKNPNIIANIVKDDSLGTKIVYDYSNVTKKSTSKTMIVLSKEKLSESSIPQLHDNALISTESNNLSVSGDLYRRAILEEQIKSQFILDPMLQNQHKMNFDSSVNSKVVNYNRLITQKSTQEGLDCSLNQKAIVDEIPDSQQQRPPSFSRSRRKNNKISSKSSEIRCKSTESNITRIVCIEASNISESKQSQKSVHKNVPEFIREIETKSSSSNPEVKSNVLSKTDEKQTKKSEKPSNTNLTTTSKSVADVNELENEEFLKSIKDKTIISKKKAESQTLESVEEDSKILHKSKKQRRKDPEKDLLSKSCEHKIKKPKKAFSVSKDPKSDIKTSNLTNLSDKTLKTEINPKVDENKDLRCYLDLKKQKRESESAIQNNTPVKKCKNILNQDLDCSLNKNFSNICEASFSANSDDKVTNNLEPEGTKQKKISNKGADIKINENRKDSKIKQSLQAINNIDSSMKPILKLRKLDLKNYPAVISNGDSLDVDKRSQKSKDTQDENNVNQTTKSKLKSPSTSNSKKSHKRKSPKENTDAKDTEVEPLKKSITSTEQSKDITPKKITNSPARRFYRELNNLKCTFKTSLLPQTIGKRRCSSSWLNFNENVERQISKNIHDEITPAPIKRRRQTYCAVPNLKLTLQRSSSGNDDYHIKGIEKENDEEDTDELDTDEHRDLETSEPDIMKRNDDSNNKKETFSCSNLDAIPIQSTIAKSLANTDSKMTFKSTRTCVLCDKNSNDLTSHYVVKHKTESYVSRLSSNDLDRLKKDTNIAIPVYRNIYKIICVFCKQMVKDQFENLCAHFSYHTGEYNFQCEGCKIKKPYKEDIISHQLRSRFCRNSKMITIHKDDLEKGTIYLHVCKICNFVNLNESNLKNHLQKQHGFNFDILDNSEKCILLLKKVNPLEYNKSNNGCEAGDDIRREEEAPLCAEQDFICELPMDIQNILVNEKKSLPETVVRLKRNSNFLSEHDKTVPPSPEKLLQEMHAVPSKSRDTTTTEGVLREIFAGNLHAESNPNDNVKVSGNNRSHTNIVNVAKESKKEKLNCELPKDSQNASDSESLTNIEDYIKNTTNIPSPTRSDIPECESNNNSIKKEVNSKSPVGMTSSIERVFTLKTPSTRISIDNSFEDIEPLRSIDVSDGTSNKVCIFPTGNNSETVSIPEEDLLHSESITSIEAYIKSTNENTSQSKSLHEKLCQKQERNQETLDDFHSKTSIEEFNQSIENLDDEPHDPEKCTHTQVIDKTINHSLSPFESEIENSSQNNSQSMIYRQYDNLDPYNFNLFKCLMEDCLYSTNSKEDFKLHALSHNDQIKLFDCPYCPTKNSCLENVIQHIWHEHSLSNYQCTKCSYRSLVPGHVIIHSKMFHIDSRIDEPPIYKCGYFKVSKESQLKAMDENIKNKAASMKCPDCSYRFFSTVLIKSHLQKSHPCTFQRLSSLNLNNLTCLHCKKESNCNEEMRKHLSLHHPDEPGFVIETILKAKQTEAHNDVNDLTVVDISIDCVVSDINILEESERVNILNSIEESIKIEKVINNHGSIDSINNCTTNQQPKEILSPLPNHQLSSPLNLGKPMEEASQRRENDIAQLSESVADSVICEPFKNEHIKQAEPIVVEEEQLTSLESKRLDNFSEAIVREEIGERLKSLLELLVEDTGVHRSTLYRCPSHCNSSFMHFELWRNHIKSRHKGTEDLVCPYCTELLQYSSAEAHFKNHLQHEFICYYCLVSCSSKKKMQEHFASFHENCNTIELPIASLYLVINEDAIISDYNELLESFSEALFLHLTKKIQKHTVNEWVGKELTDICLYEMEIPQYKPQPEDPSLFKCFGKFCSFVSKEESLFDDHLIQHQLQSTFKCKYCTYPISKPSLEIIKCHHLQHLSANLLICCVCKFVHYDNHNIMEHIKNLHNCRDVPVLRVQKSDLSYKVSLSIFLPPNEMSFSTSKSCFCCAKEIRNNKKYLGHLKKVHKLSFCLRCQLCDKIVLTHLDAEAHCREHHPIEPFKLKYEVLTPYLYNLIIRSRSPLTIEVRLRKEKPSDQRKESNLNESLAPPPVAIKEEEILVKDELEDDNQTPSISIKCLRTNQLFEDISGLEKDSNAPQNLRRFNETDDVGPSKEPQTCFVNQDIQPRANSESSTQQNQQYLFTSTNNAVCPSQIEPIINGVSLLPQSSSSNSTTTDPHCLTLHLDTEQQPRTVEGLQRIPVITNRVAQPNIQSPTIVHNYTAPLYNNTAQVNIRTNLEEIAPICGSCDFECTDFIHLQAHYEATHAVNNQPFYFYVDRKIGCMYCTFQGSVRALSTHHATLHTGKTKLCYSVIDPTRCGMCNDIFRYSLPASVGSGSYSLPSVCGCPGNHQRTLADCLNLPILRTLQDIGYQYYRSSSLEN